MAFILETTDTAGEVTRRLEPLRKYIESITRLLKAAKEDEDKTSPGLPPPDERKGIEAPRKQLAAPNTKEKPQDLDDEIPF